jgi:hypothetical protein
MLGHYLGTLRTSLRTIHYVCTPAGSISCARAAGESLFLSFVLRLALFSSLTMGNILFMGS